MTQNLNLSRLAAAVRIALVPQPTTASVETDPDQGCAAMELMARSLETRQNEAGESRERAVKVDRSGTPLAGEEASSIEQGAAGFDKVSGSNRAGEEIGAPGDAADGDEAEDQGTLSMADSTAEQRRRMRDTQELREMIGSRIRAAREFGAVSQTDFAQWIGHRKSTQPSLWEKGARLPPVHELPNIARVLGVSIDFLMGLTEEPEPDQRTARRVQVVSQVRAAVEAMADVLADQLLHEAGAVDGLVRSVGLVTKVERLVSAVGAVRASNADAFDEVLRGGATLVRAAAEAQKAAAMVGAAMDAADVATERAHNRLRAAVRDAAA